MDLRKALNEFIDAENSLEQTRNYITNLISNELGYDFGVQIKRKDKDGIVKTIEIYKTGGGSYKLSPEQLLNLKVKLEAKDLYVFKDGHLHNIWVEL
jgi:hypothetical protein